MAHGIAKRMGYEVVPWYVLTQIVLSVYTVLTIFSMFFRPDFFNVYKSNSYTYRLQFVQWPFTC